MSTVSVTNIKNAASASNNLVLDTSGNTTAAGTVAMGSSYLRNRIINGAMVIDQRNGGASVTVSNAAGVYSVDRFAGLCQQATGAFTMQQSSTAPAGFVNSLLLTVTNTTAPSSTNRVSFRQPIEGLNISDFAWGTASAVTVTLSFWVRSSVTGTYGVGFINSAENRSYVGLYTVNSANTFEYKTITVSGDQSGTWLTTNGNGIRLTFDLGSGSSFNASSASTWVAQEACRTSACVNWQQNSGATFYITGVQLEVGTVATPFERRLYGQELALCQRYYWRNSGSGSSTFHRFVFGIASTTSQVMLIFQNPAQMRANPTTLDYGGTLAVYDGATVTNISSLAFDVSAPIVTSVNAAGTGFTQFRPYELIANNSSTAYVGFGAEL